MAGPRGGIATMNGDRVSLSHSLSSSRSLVVSFNATVDSARPSLFDVKHVWTRETIRFRGGIFKKYRNEKRSIVLIYFKEYLQRVNNRNVVILFLMDVEILLVT